MEPETRRPKVEVTQKFSYSVVEKILYKEAAQKANACAWIFTIRLTYLLHAWLFVIVTETESEIRK